MQNAIVTMLAKYNTQTQQDYINALKEIFQEIALLGLWRAKFFEHAAFYGGTALRILYGLDRFSEDMDFSLLNANPNFSLQNYNQAVKQELHAFGFNVEIQNKQKNHSTPIESAFIKANTIQQLIAIEVPRAIIHPLHNMHSIKIKMEIDTQPPNNFSTEVKNLLLPIPFSILTYCQEDLFAGKIHALLCRSWKNRVKGRDWYDYYWYISRNITVNLKHLTERLRASGHWEVDHAISHTTLIKLIEKKIKTVNFSDAKNDVIPFLNDSAALDLWSQSFFNELTQQLKTHE